jgi:hypothetical protein
LISTALLIDGSMLVSVIKTRHLPKQIAAESIHGWCRAAPPERTLARLRHPPSRYEQASN